MKVQMIQLMVGGYEREKIRTVNGMVNYYDYLVGLRDSIKAVKGRKAELRLCPNQCESQAFGRGPRWELWVDNFAEREEEKKRKSLSLAKVNSTVRKHNDKVRVVLTKKSGFKSEAAYTRGR